MAQVMGLGAVGEDGKVGGRLERELEVWETVVRGKRKGYREKVKQRESGLGLLETAMRVRYRMKRREVKGKRRGRE